MESLYVSLAVVVVVVIILLKTAVVVPQQNAYVIERLGKFSRALDAGFHILIPFLERIAYRLMVCKRNNRPSSVSVYQLRQPV